MRRHYSAIFALQQGRCPSLNFFAGVHNRRILNQLAS